MAEFSRDQSFPGEMAALGSSFSSDEAAADLGASGRRRCCPKWALDL